MHFSLKYVDLFLNVKNISALHADIFFFLKLINLFFKFIIYLKSAYFKSKFATDVASYAGLL